MKMMKTLNHRDASAPENFDIWQLQFQIAIENTIYKKNYSIFN